MKLGFSNFSLTKHDLIQAGKIALGSFLSLMIADSLGLQYATSAAIITLLTTLTTKKETLLLSAKRLISFCFTIAISFVVYHFIGIHSLAFGIFMLFIVTLSYFFNWHGALSINAVIGTHVLMENAIHTDFIMNEFLLVLVGSVVAALMNVYMPDTTKEIKNDIYYIEELERNILYHFSDYLKHMKRGEKDHQAIFDLEAHLDEALARAIRNTDNTMYEHSRYYITYMEMRSSQCKVLHQIMHSLHAMKGIPTQARIISEFLRHVGDSLHERNNAADLLAEIKDIFRHMETQPLPKDRAEFENRAILYHLLIEMESFLIIKKEFTDSMTKEQVRIYWNESA